MSHDPISHCACSKAMNSTATAVRAEPIPDSACLTPRNGKRKMPPPAPLLAALFGPDYQTMSPDPRLPPFNERVTGMHAPSGVAPTVGGAPSPSGLSLFSAVRGGPATVSKLPDSLRRSHASGVPPIDTCSAPLSHANRHKEQSRSYAIRGIYQCNNGLP